MFGRVDAASGIGWPQGPAELNLSVAAPTLVNMAFATEHPVLAHSEYRAVEDVVRAGGRFEVVSEYAAGR